MRIPRFPFTPADLRRLYAFDEECKARLHAVDAYLAEQEDDFLTRDHHLRRADEHWRQSRELSENHPNRQ